MQWISIPLQTKNKIVGLAYNIDSQMSNAPVVYIQVQESINNANTELRFYRSETHELFWLQLVITKASCILENKHLERDTYVVWICSIKG